MKHILIAIFAALAGLARASDVPLGVAAPSPVGDNGSLSYSLSPNTDDIFQTGYGMMGLATSGTSTAFYLAQASNFNSTDYSIRQLVAGDTAVNAKTGQQVTLRTNNVARLTVGASQITAVAGAPITASDTTDATSGSAAAINTLGGVGVTKKVWVGDATASAVTIGTAGGGISIKSGSNARCGTATLSAGTIVVANTSVTANTRVMCTVQAPGGTQGFLSTSKINATSFTITSTNAADTSVVAWALIENP